MNTRAIGWAAGVVVIVGIIGTEGPAFAQDARSFAYRVSSRYDGSSDDKDVIVQGSRARVTYGPADESNPRGAVLRQINGEFELWLEGGTRRLVVDRAAHTYYERPRITAGRPPSRSVGVFGAPATVESVSDVRVSVRTEPERTNVAGLSCVHVALDVSFRLNLTAAGVRFPASVQATAGFDVTDSLPVERLPFDDGVASLVTGYDEVDRAIAQRLGATRGTSGISIRTVIKARRQIESSPATEDSLETTIENFRETTAPPGAFDLPPGLRYQEPVVIGPTRK